MTPSGEGGFSIGDLPSLDTDTLGGWGEPFDLCPAVIVIVVDGMETRLRCELDGPHVEHEVALRWVDQHGDDKAE